ncbi:MAG TPA: UDP-N-acetylglucosamine acyltransferase [Verrucomicrobiae bacterium]|jgi:UDP-N-acetylglucosamine acyltransferase|nr:UDP-N-acetylglucosamine acyltransferase [Verrucomicrobiae bacterium]
MAAILGNQNQVHATAVIEPSVVLGGGNVIGAFAMIAGNVSIGNGNWIGPHTTIGTPAQFSTEKFELTGEKSTGGIRIGDRNVIREYCTVHQPSKFQTLIENDCYLMAYAHVSHDTRIRSRAILANNVQIGGFSDIGEGTNVGLSTVIHQFTTLGAYAMVGMGAIVAKDVPPFAKVVGSPLRYLDINRAGMMRSGFNESEINEAEQYVLEALRPHSERLAEYAKAFESRRRETGRPILVVLRAS